MQEVLFDYIHAYCFGGINGGFNDCSLSYNILGTKYHIRKAITQQTIKDFIKIHYHPSRMILVAAGGVDHDDVVEYANKCFTRTDPYVGPGTPTFDREAIVTDSEKDVFKQFWGKDTQFHSCEMRDHQPTNNTVAGCLAYPTTGWSHADSTAMLIVSQIIGMSRVFRNMFLLICLYINRSIRSWSRWLSVFYLRIHRSFTSN